MVYGVGNRGRGRDVPDINVGNMRVYYRSAEDREK
mgnify:CR=1 FL=1|jgi:hypothetical protein